MVTKVPSSILQRSGECDVCIHQLPTTIRVVIAKYDSPWSLSEHWIILKRFCPDLGWPTTSGWWERAKHRLIWRNHRQIQKQFLDHHHPSILRLGKRVRIIDRQVGQKRCPSSKTGSYFAPLRFFSLSFLYILIDMLLDALALSRHSSQQSSGAESSPTPTQMRKHKAHVRNLHRSQLVSSQPRTDLAASGIIVGDHTLHESSRHSLLVLPNYPRRATAQVAIDPPAPSSQEFVLVNFFTVYIRLRSRWLPH